jgi:hypothetical protein
VKEVDDFLKSTDVGKGMNLFKTIEAKIVEELGPLIEQRKKGVAELNSGKRRRLEENQEKPVLDETVEKEQYRGDGLHDRLFIYLSSDNERVKEAFAAYLENHDQIAVIRVKTDLVERHVKGGALLNHLNPNGTVAAFTLVADWYALSLSNVMFTWRRDTKMLSSFTQVSYTYFLLLLFFHFR